MQDSPNFFIQASKLDFFCDVSRLILVQQQQQQQQEFVELKEIKGWFYKGYCLMDALFLFVIFFSIFFNYCCYTYDKKAKSKPYHKIINYCIRHTFFLLTINNPSFRKPNHFSENRNYLEHLSLLAALFYFFWYTSHSVVSHPLGNPSESRLLHSLLALFFVIFLFQAI